MNVTQLQRDMQSLGLYPGEIDGIWGSQSSNAYAQLLSHAEQHIAAGKRQPPSSNVINMAWGKKVSETFKQRVAWIAKELRMPVDGADWLMSCMAFESAETFRSDVRNAAGSGATGLIQFMPATAKGLGTTTALLALMTPEDQLNFVYKYFEPFKGRLNSLGDVYMAILWPAGVGKPDDWVLWEKGSRPTTFRQNSGLDVNNDKRITKGEAVSKVRAKLTRGRQFFYG